MISQGHDQTSDDGQNTQGGTDGDAHRFLHTLGLGRSDEGFWWEQHNALILAKVKDVWLLHNAGLFTAKVYYFVAHALLGKAQTRRYTCTVAAGASATNTFLARALGGTLGAVENNGGRYRNVLYAGKSLFVENLD